MLDIETKRRIDSARDILVGKVPNPQGQVEQITIALIYKFMDDMDHESVKMGGQASFFTGEFEKYAWTQLFDPQLGGREMLERYSEAINRMDQNPGIPQFFRDIFKNANLPYRDPATLKLFLKTINDFTYDHSERLGDAFEYLLSVLSSQGDAGMFRTPRHIIDFMVEILNPQKNERILDPSCGTAGFLISAYKHIKRQNANGKALTPQELMDLPGNFSGYDISPEMVRLSLVNMYLHGFTQPGIHEYDTLTSDERWNEYADVILANPPFMTPKGGIRPHSRFSVKSNRSEVLFVDYIAEHLTPNGRAAIIVPEGIIFKSEVAYKKLRKNLIENNYLWAVISLPAGVFNPYAGVKTSILLLDRELAKKTDKILFVKVESDGFDLGAQRRPIERNDLPVVTHVIHMYQEQIQNSQDQDDTYHEIETVIDITKLRRNGEYNLSFERYVEIKNTGSSYPVRPLSEIVRIESGSRQKGGAISNGTPSIGGEQIDSDGSIRFEKMRYISDDFFMEMKHGKLQENDVLIVKDGATTGKMGFYRFKCDAAVNEHVYILRSNEAILPIYLYSTLKSHCFQRKLKPYIKGIIGGISLEFAEITIPVPPLDKQREIVAEIEGYQRIIDGARQVVENWKPNIEWELEEERRAAGVDAWPLVKLGEVCEKVVGGGTPSTANPDYWQGEIPWISSADIVDEYNANPRRKITEEAIRNSATNLIPKGNVVVVTRVGLGKLFLNSFDVCISQDSQGLIINKQVIFSPYLLHVLSQKVQIFKQTSQGSTIQGVTKAQLLSLDVPLPPMDRQRSIVSRIEAEKHVIDTNRALVEAYEERIRKVVERVWE